VRAAFGQSGNKAPYVQKNGGKASHSHQNSSRAAQNGGKSAHGTGKGVPKSASGKNAVRSAGKLQRVFGEESGRILRDAERIARGKSGGGANRGKTSKKRR
jgi:hypothetical protein